MVNPTRELWPDCMQKCNAILGNSICCSFQVGCTYAVSSVLHAIRSTKTPFS